MMLTDILAKVHDAGGTWQGHWPTLVQELGKPEELVVAVLDRLVRHNVAQVSFVHDQVNIMLLKEK